MKDDHYYTCEFCYKEFIPKRRRVQKYCSPTCRSKAWLEKKEVKSTTTTLHKVQKTNTQQLKEKKTKIESVSVPGITNAALGSLTADGIKALMTPQDDKPVTKGDLKALVNKLNTRYHYIKNVPQDQFGRYPFYDMTDGNLVYLNAKS